MASTTSRWFVLAALWVGACAGHPDSTECATGITCPEGTTCAAVQAVCITNNCGDGIVQGELGEKCDDGNIVDGDGCAANCLSREVCGDGVINTAAGELCDDSNTLGGDGCAADCRSVEVCGNGIKDVGEACDDGNTVSGDGCSGNCKSTEICGNNIVDVNEACDDGGAPGGCNPDCQGGIGCGDGAIDHDINGNPIEECDDGNNDPNDDCIPVTCKRSRCGDGIIQTSGTHIEQCDPSVNFGETAGCNIDCTNAGCGDGKINNALLEQCDDGNAVNEDACKNNCKLNVCGDGVDGGPNEACDDGGDTMMCNANCKSPGCGDFYVNAAFGEQCDTGGVNTPTCDANCTAPICGDGTTNMMAGEQCDDMNASNDDACLNDCKNNTCGDGFVNPAAEACDDHNQMDESSCPYGQATCQLCNMDCSAVENLTGNTCGDGVTGGPETCDDNNTTNESACPYGVTSCAPCNSTCSGTLSPTTVSFCGDRTTQMPQENCDDGNTDACGTCDAACNQFASSEATGYIVAAAGSAMHDNDTLVIGDGTITVTFEFDKNDDGVTMGNVKITTGAGDTDSQMRDHIRSAIDGTALKITTADIGGTVVGLTHQRKTSLGNVTIPANTVNTNSFEVHGMSGGAGGNCGTGLGCKTDDDCASHNCVGSSHTCQP